MTTTSGVTWGGGHGLSHALKAGETEFQPGCASLWGWARRQGWPQPRWCSDLGVWLGPCY